MRQVDYRLFADYFQFYLQDESAEGAPPRPALSWTRVLRVSGNV